MDVTVTEHKHRDGNFAHHHIFAMVRYHIVRYANSTRVFLTFDVDVLDRRVPGDDTTQPLCGTINSTVGGHIPEVVYGHLTS